MATPRRYRVIAHRGASAYEPENTLRAFRRAIELGADMSELDVHLSRDGHLIVMHDETVDKTTDGHGAIRDMTLGDLERLDAGQGEHVPTLQSVLDLACQFPPHGLYVEMKGEGTPEPTMCTYAGKAVTPGHTNWSPATCCALCGQPGWDLSFGTRSAPVS